MDAKWEPKAKEGAARGQTVRFGGGKAAFGKKRRGKPKREEEKTKPHQVCV